jgi:hypothetical protein
MSDNREIRLFDGQWVNVMNHDYCYENYTKEEAVVKAVKMTEELMAKNFADNKWPPKREAVYIIGERR